MSKGKASPSKQVKISAFFSQDVTPPSPLKTIKSGQGLTASLGAGKRNAPGSTHVNTPIDLTIDSDTEESTGEPATKKRKTGSANSAFSQPSGTRNASGSHNNSGPGSRRPLTQSTIFPISSPPLSAPPVSSQIRDSAAEKYRFNPGSQAPVAEEPVNEAEDRIRTERREKAKKILLGGQRVFSGSGVEADVPLFLEESDEEDGDNLTGVNAPAHGDGEGSGDEGTDAKFKDMLAMFEAGTSKGKKKAKNPPQAKGKTPRTKGRSKKVEEIGPSGLPYTPLELQVRDLKAKYPGTILMFEVGYKLKFFGDDAPIAAKELGIVAFQHRNFMNAMIPVHRREVHLKKLLSQGYKVGIIEQTETAALKKVGNTRNELFSRELTHLYTAATYVDQLGSVDDVDPVAAPPLMCLVEELRGGMGADERVNISMITISPSTGDVVWDEFEDNHMRTELETRMVHISPSELLLPEEGLSKSTEKILAYFTTHSWTDHKIRIERYSKKWTYTNAFSYLSEFYTDKNKGAAGSESFKSGELLAAVSDFPKQVVIALAQAVKYLSAFEVADALLETRFFSKFTERTHMLLNGNTLTNLEIYQNETDFKKKGSLMWILDRTTTRFGARMLKSWVGRPLTDVAVLKERTDAIQEIIATTSSKIVILRQLLKKLPDLARGLCRVQYGKCTPQELAVLLPAFNKIAQAFELVQKPEEVGFSSAILNDIIFTLPKLREPIKGLLDAISLKKATAGEKDALWTDIEKFPVLDEVSMAIQAVESELMLELKNLRRTVKKPSLQYSTWMGEEYVIELKKAENREVPVDWILLSATKTVRRYHPPNVKEKLRERAQWKETLAAEANKAFQTFLEEISQNHYGILRDAVNKLAVADCLLSLALVSMQEGYVRPIFCNDEDTLQIVEGRHPMVEALRDDPFVPNSVCMGYGEPRSKVVTGPNMGGKSSVVRMIALCAIMAQIGSYVPAEAMRVSMLDGILTRMGASDELVRGRSTFMVEMQETSEILHLATRKSLVILDELGRGTSTFDGMAVASATLQHLVQATQCKTLFITHYPQVATDIQRKFPEDVENLHMGFAEDTRIDGRREVTFLYKLSPGLANASFGVECARLAGMPEEILRSASTQSQRMKELVESRVKQNKIRKCIELLRKTKTSSNTQTETRRLSEEIQALLG